MPVTLASCNIHADWDFLGMPNNLPEGAGFPACRNAGRSLRLHFARGSLVTLNDLTDVKDLNGM